MYIVIEVRFMRATGGVLIYKTEDGLIKLDVEHKDGNVWLTQAQISQLYGCERSVITKHCIIHHFRRGAISNCTTKYPLFTSIFHHVTMSISSSKSSIQLDILPYDVRLTKQAKRCC